MKKLALLQKIIIYTIFFVLPLSLSADESVYIIKGKLAEKNGKYSEAIEEYNKALDENQNIIELYNKIGHIYRFELKDNLKAIQTYLKGLKIAPYSFGLNMNIMYLYFDQDELENGIKHYRILSNIRKEEDRYSFPRKTLEKIFDGMTQDEILNFCDDYLSINPTDIILREYLASIYMAKKNYKHAKTEYENMIGFGDKTGFIYFSLGVCNYYLGLYQESLNNFTNAKELGSSVPQKYFDMIYEKIGNS